MKKLRRLTSLRLSRFRQCYRFRL